MLKRYCIIFAVLISCLYGHDLQLIPHFGENPGHLRMYTYFPKKAKAQENPALVVVLHGSWQSAISFSQKSGMNEIADSCSFVILYPDQAFKNNFLTAFSFYSAKKMKKGQGETASIKNMIDYCVHNFSIDPHQIYIWGMSAGGAMANVMLNAYPELFAAGAMLAPPSILHEGVNTTSSAKPRIAIVQGERDLTVWPRHANKVQKQWETYFGLSSSDLLYETNYLNHPLLKLSRYKNAENQLLRLDIAQTGHLLPIASQQGPQGGKKGIYSKDMDFSLSYWVCEFFGLIK